MIADCKLQIAECKLPLETAIPTQSAICNLKSEIPRPSPLLPRPSRRGFTLVEILVVVTVIAILAGITFGALRMARQSACEAKTKATIVKLDQVISQKYDSYLTRRAPLVFPVGTNPKLAAQIRLEAIRDLMRMEMPQNFSDITNNPWSYGWGSLPSRPALSQLYKNYYDSHRPKNNDNESAKCLYLFVTMGSPEARELFSQTEITTADDGGWPMFVDGWGNPIKFLRWAPAFNDSDIQPNISTWSSDSDRQAACDNDHDPFDPRKTDVKTSDNKPSGWRLRPLIFSAGADKEFGMAGFALPAEQQYPYNGTPYAAGAGSGIGAPDLTGKHYDNIHNHRIEQR